MKSIGLIALAVLCGSAFAQHTITLNLQGLTPHVGQMFKARMVETPSGKQVAETTFTALPGPGLTLVFLGESGKSYTLDYFADMNGDRAYSAPPADHAWRKAAGPLHHDGIIINVSHDSDFTDIRYPNGPAGIRSKGLPVGTRPETLGISLQVVLAKEGRFPGARALNILGRASRIVSGVHVLEPMSSGSH